MRNFTIYETDLYVMQNEHGLIKIGRSVNPQKRRRTLQAIEHCKIELVITLVGKGGREEKIHRKLKKYHIEGEWFDGGNDARAAICRALNQTRAIDWPFKFDEIASDTWLDQFFEWREQRLNDKTFENLFRRVRAAAQPGWSVDSDIWHLLGLSEIGELMLIEVNGNGVEVVLKGICPCGKVISQIPEYSSDLNAAMKLWQNDARPAAWNGTALDCCIAALRVRQQKMPRGWQKKFQIKSSGKA